MANDLEITINNEDKIRKGFRVVGPNLIDRKKSEWHFSDLTIAKNFATQMAQLENAEYDVLKYVGSIRKASPVYPTEWIPSEDE